MSSQNDNEPEQPARESMPREFFEALYDSVAQELRNINTSFTGAAAAPATNYGPYHQAAAVLSAFEISTIKPATSSGTTDKIEELLADSTVVYEDPMPSTHRHSSQSQSNDNETNESLLALLGARPSRWTLLPDVRRRVIEQMGTRTAFLEALAANPERSDDAMQRMIERYLKNEAPPLSSQNVEELSCTAQIVEWFHGHLDNLPDPQTVARQLDQKRQRQPFEKLVGQHFSGREEQLRKLREYVGVLEPTSVWSRVKRKTESFLNWREKPPLMIYGPGGVGKSTLVAKFILDHTNLNAIQRFPYAYLDFDRPGLLAEEPATLLVEAVRQLGIQYPDVQEHTERVRKVWEEELSVVARQAQSLGSEAAPLGSAKLSKQQRTTLLKDFDALLNAMGLSDEPFLLVLDTFEEVQYRSHQYIEQLLEALEELQSILPRLRTVFSGRALLKDFATEEVALNDLDAAAARGFLTASKIEPKTLIDTIVKRIGGNPLSLRLAVQIFHNEGGASREFFNRLQKERIQSALYTRVLEHIHDKNVMKLAHPGLILRRITPGLILKVLAKPCKVEVKDLVEAEKLFDSLSQEITLVVPGGTTKDEPRALRHMTEVRRGMIQLLREDEEQKDKVLEIQQNAIAYYEPFDDPVSRAEEIYHRLMLKDDHDVIAERWIAGVRDNLFNAIEELEPKEQGFLAARLDVDIEDDILAQANQADWEVIVSRRVNNFLSLGQPDRALQTLGMRNEYLPGSVLYVLQAQAYQGMGRLEEAAAVIDRGLASYPDSTWVTFRLTMMAGGVDLLMGRHQKAFQRLLDGRKLASEMNAPMQKVEATLGLLRPELSNLLEADTRASLEKELLELLKTIPDSTLSEQLGLVRYAVDRFGERDDDLVIRAVRLVGFESANQRQLRSLARAIAEWDLSLSSAANADPGLLARKARIPLLSEISETWKQFAQTFPPTVVKDVVSLLLSNYAMTPNVRSALIAILRTPSRDEVSSETQDPSDAAGSGNTRVGTGIPVTPITLRLTPDERQSVTYALMSAFPTRSSLERMLFYRLNINLNSISLTDNLNSTVDILVQYAETRGLMVHLIAVARESNPGNVYLANIARKFGLSPDSEIEEVSETEAETAGGIADVGQWRTLLSEMTGRVCRVELSPQVSRANGFLVGANVLVTTYGALEPVIKGNMPVQNVAFRFDYKIYNDTAVNPGTVYRLAKDNWLILAVAGELNFAMVRLEGLPGREPVGGERAEPGASPRGWIYVEPAKAKNLAAADQIMLLHYSSGESLKLVSDTSGFKLNDERTRLYYDLNADLSPGAPCFNGNWELVGLHLGVAKGSGEGYGTSVAAVINELERNGFDLVGRDKFEATVLRGDRVFVNRAELRQALREMVAPSGRRILVVNGPHGSGKTYTREYVLDVAYNTPNHRVIYVDLDSSDFSPAQLVELIGEQMNFDVRSLPMLDTEQESRWIRRVVDYLTGQIRSNTIIKWWLILDGFSKPLSPSTNDLIVELAHRVRSVELRLILLNYTLPLPVDVSSGVIREDIKPIGREDVEAFLAQRIQNDPGTSSETIKAIVDQVLAAADEASASDNYPTASYLRLLNRAITRMIPGDPS